MIHKALNSEFLINIFDQKTASWHKDDSIEPKVSEEIETLITGLHFRNYQLWHTEDEARRIDVDDSHIADCKRRIDKLNQSRQDRIEKIDESIIQMWEWVSENLALPINSETPGSIIDRLSVASLKIFHMREQTERKDVDAGHIENCKAKLERLYEQRRDLAAAFDCLIDDLYNRRKRLKVYRQFKMYNDPMLNPAIYANKR